MYGGNVRGTVGEAGRVGGGGGLVGPFDFGDVFDVVGEIDGSFDCAGGALPVEGGGVFGFGVGWSSRSLWWDAHLW